MGLADRDYMKRPVGDAARPNMSDGRENWKTAGLVLLLLALLALAAMVSGVWPNRQPEVEFPPNGTVAYVGGKAPDAETARFTVSDASKTGLNKVIRFRAPDATSLAAELYLQSGQSGEVQLRPGIYRVHFSEGEQWQGPDQHFGVRSSTHDFGTHAIGGAMAGMTIQPRSPVGNGAPIAASRF